eukprot:g6323.t1
MAASSSSSNHHHHHKKKKKTLAELMQALVIGHAEAEGKVHVITGVMSKYADEPSVQCDGCEAALRVVHLVPGTGESSGESAASSSLSSHRHQHPQPHTSRHAPPSMPSAARLYQREHQIMPDPALEVRRRVESAELVDGVMGMIDHHPQNMVVLRSACLAMNALCDNPANRALFVRHGAHRRLMTALEECGKGGGAAFVDLALETLHKVTRDNHQLGVMLVSR